MEGRVHTRELPAGLFRVAAAVALAASVALAADCRFLPVQADQSTPPHVSAGQILVARRSLEDPNFAETVIVLVQADDEGTLGLIINRQTKLPVSRLARDLQGAKGRTEPLYLGGPVAVSGIMGLIRSGGKLEDGKHVFSDIYMISSKAAVEKAFASSSDPKTFRLYLGYAGWDAGQLEFEMGMDAWEVLPPNAAIVFDSHPETLWQRLMDQKDQRMVRLPHPSIPILGINFPVHAAD